MGFLVGTGGGRESVREGSAGSVFAGRRALLNDPIYYVIPYILSGGGFTTSCFRPSRTKTPNPRSSMSWTDTYVVEVSTTDLLHFVPSRTIVYYESIKREVKTNPIYECVCYERLKTKAEESTHLTYTRFLGELEHLKIETRLIDEIISGCECGWTPRNSW